MPTIARIGPYRFFFYADDHDEPIHVHVEREQKVAKFWLDPIRLARSGGFSGKELVRIQRIVQDDRAQFVEAWHVYFGS
jgi:hypothetical protein